MGRDFITDLKNSLSNTNKAIAEKVLREIYGVDCLIEWNEAQGNDYGVDVVVNGSIAIDIKFRSQDPIKYGSDDCICEILSVVEKASPGWTISPHKKNDFVLYIWCNTERWEYLDAKLLREAVLRNIGDLERTCNRFFLNDNGNYSSYAIAVDRKEILSLIKKLEARNNN